MHFSLNHWYFLCLWKTDLKGTFPSYLIFFSILFQFDCNQCLIQSMVIFVYVKNSNYYLFHFDFFNMDLIAMSIWFTLLSVEYIFFWCQFFAFCFSIQSIIFYCNGCYIQSVHLWMAKIYTPPFRNSYELFSTTI